MFYNVSVLIITDAITLQSRPGFFAHSACSEEKTTRLAVSTGGPEVRPIYKSSARNVCLWHKGKLQIHRSQTTCRLLPRDAMHARYMLWPCVCVCHKTVFY